MSDGRSSEITSIHYAFMSPAKASLLSALVQRSPCDLAYLRGGPPNVRSLAGRLAMCGGGGGWQVAANDLGESVVRFGSVGLSIEGG